MTTEFSAQAIVGELTGIYEKSVANLRQALAAYVTDRTAPDAAARSAGSFA